MKRRLHATPVLLGVALAGAMLAAPARGADLYWFADGMNPGGTGNWSAAGMTWSTTTPAPTLTVWDPNQTAVFQPTAGTVTITDLNIDAAAGMRFETDLYVLTGGSLTLTGAASALNSISVSAAATATSNVVIAGSAGLTKIGAGTFVLGVANTITGETVIEGGTLTVTGSASTAANTYVGYNNPTNSFIMVGSGSFSCLNSYLGVLPTSSGNMGLVTGTTSAWITTTDLAVGYQGPANMLTVSDAGAVATANGFVGLFSTSTGNSVLVSSGGSWTNSNQLYVGQDGSGNAFRVESGGHATSSTDTVIGFSSVAANNALTVKDPGSTFQIPSPFTLVIGDDGDDNRLEISDGGVVTGHNARLARSANASDNTATVTGSGSKWTNTGTLRIGALGPGNSVTVSAGGEVSFAGDTTLGFGAAAANNALTVTGMGSKWTGGGLAVGLASLGNVLTVSNHASLTASAVAVAVNAGSAGTVNIGQGGAAGTLAAPILFGNGAGVLNFNHTDPAYAFTHPIGGAGAVFHIGTGTTILSGPCTYSGGTTITAGTLRLASSTALPNGGPVTLNGGILDANNYSLTLGTLSLQANSTLKFSGAAGSQSIVFASAAPYIGGVLLVTGVNLANDSLVITADPTASGILDHIQFTGYPVGARWEPGTGRVLPRLANIAAPAPALSPTGGALALVVLCGVAALALSRPRQA